MGAPRKLAGPAADLLLRRAAEGRSHREIRDELAAQGVEVDYRTVGRALARHGLARRPSSPSRGAGRADERDLGGATPAAANLDASEGQLGASVAVDLSPPSEEEQVLRASLEILRSDLERPIPPSDRARVSSEIRALLGRLDELALRRRAAEARRVDDGAAERVRQRLERIASRTVVEAVPATTTTTTKGARRAAAT